MEYGCDIRNLKAQKIHSNPEKYVREGVCKDPKDLSEIIANNFTLDQGTSVYVSHRFIVKDGTKFSFIFWFIILEASLGIF